MLKNFFVELLIYIFVVYVPFILFYGFFVMVGMQFYVPGLAFRIAFGVWFLIWHLVMAIQFVRELTGEE